MFFALSYYCGQKSRDINVNLVSDFFDFVHSNHNSSVTITKKIATKTKKFLTNSSYFLNKNVL